MTKQEEKTMGMLAHLLGIFSGFIGPLVIFLAYNKNDKAKENAKHALNFQLSLIIYYIISAILILILIGFLLIGFLYVFGLITAIIGAVKANNGEVYSYPLEIKFIK